MSEEDKSTTLNKPPAGPNSPKPESPTTARPLEFDDETQETGVTAAASGAANTAQTETETETENPPPKPPRPVSPRQQAETTLKEAFPTIEGSVVKAVLVASGWNVERAFHALLGMTDPNAQTEDVPPPKPPRPTAAQRQVEADEMYARQLAEHYNRRAAPRRLDDDDPRYRQRRESEDDREYSFFDDDLPVIRDNIRKGFEDTQTKVNSWVQNLKKRWDGDEMDDDEQPSRNYNQGYRHGYGEDQIYSGARRSGDLSRRSGDRERYDADPQLLDDNFAALELRDSEAPPPRPPRPAVNPNSNTSSNPSSVRRKVSFQEGPPTEIGTSAAASETSKPAPASMGSKQSKWQPLSTTEPSPVGEHDPFSLGDSDDEKDTAKPKDSKSAAEGEPLQTVDAEAIPEDDADAAPKGNADKTEGTGKS